MEVEGPVGQIGSTWFRGCGGKSRNRCFPGQVQVRMCAMEMEGDTRKVGL